MKLKKAKKEIMAEIEIPDNVDISLNDEVNVKGQKGELSRRLKMPDIIIERKDRKIVITSKKRTKKERKIIYSIKAHIKNMISGVIERFVYKLQICSVHFPMTANVDKERNVVAIKNFLGEVKERTAKILGGIDVKIDNDIIIVEGCDVEKTGQTAANIENATKIKGRDRRIFQDGIYIISKAGEEMGQ